MAYVEDRWVKVTTTPAGQRTRTERPRHGTGLRYRVRYTDPAGAHRARSFARKEDADRFRATVEADMLRGTYLDPDAGRITLAAYTKGWLESRSWDGGTRQVVEARVNGHILPGLGSRRLDQLAARPSIVSGWVAGLPLSPRYAGHVLGTLSAILGAAVDDGLIRRNPCRAESVKKPKVDKPKLDPWDSARVAAVRAALPRRYQAMADAGSGLGLRQGEITGLPVNAIDFLRHSVRVRVQVRLIRQVLCFAPPKGGRERDVPLPETISLALAAHLAEFGATEVTLPWKEPGGKPRTETLVFTTSRGVIHRNAFNPNVWQPARRKAGVPDGREHGMHALRHHYASVLLAGGVDIRALSEFLGHHDPGFTLRTYAHLMPGAADRARKAVEAALNPSATGPGAAQAVSGKL